MKIVIWSLYTASKCMKIFEHEPIIVCLVNGCCGFIPGLLVVYFLRTEKYVIFRCGF